MIPVWISMLLVFSVLLAHAEAPAPTNEGLPLLYHDDFEAGAGHWEMTDSAAWRVGEGNGGKVLELFEQNLQPFDTSVREVIEDMENLGYRPFVLNDEERMVPFTKESQTRYCNVFFCPIRI